jgi:hypothetical protein
MPTSISSGSKTVFKSSTAQPGWTKITTYNDYALRIVSGTAGSGGTVNFSSTFTNFTVTGSASVSGTASSVTLTANQIAGHTHPAGNSLASTVYPSGTWGLNNIAPTVNGYKAPITAPTGTSGTTGNGAAHSHPFSNVPLTFSGSTINFAVQYVDMIIAQRN